MEKDMTVKAGDWMRDSGAYDPYVRIRAFTFQGRAFVARSSHADQADQWPMTVREVGMSAPVATVSNWRRLPEELDRALAQRV